MPIRLGNQAFNAINLGTTNISEVYCGSTKLWPEIPDFYSGWYTDYYDGLLVGELDSGEDDLPSDGSLDLTEYKYLYLVVYNPATGKPESVYDCSSQLVSDDPEYQYAEYSVDFTTVAGKYASTVLSRIPMSVSDCPLHIDGISNAKVSTVIPFYDDEFQVGDYYGKNLTQIAILVPSHDSSDNPDPSGVPNHTWYLYNDVVDDAHQVTVNSKSLVYIPGVTQTFNAPVTELYCRCVTAEGNPYAPTFRVRPAVVDFNNFISTATIRSRNIILANGAYCNLNEPGIYHESFVGRPSIQYYGQTIQNCSLNTSTTPHRLVAGANAQPRQALLISGKQYVVRVSADLATYDYYPVGTDIANLGYLDYNADSIYPFTAV